MSSRPGQGNVQVRLSVAGTDQVTRALDDIASSAQGSSGTVVDAFKLIGAAIAALAITELVSSFAEYARRVIETSDALGTLDSATARAAGRMQQAMGEMNASADSMARSFLDGLLPAVADSMEGIAKATDTKGGEAFKKLGEIAGNVIRGITAGVLILGTSISALYDSITELSLDPLKEIAGKAKTIIDEVFTEAGDKEGVSFISKARLDDEIDEIKDKIELNKKMLGAALQLELESYEKRNQSLNDYLANRANLIFEAGYAERKLLEEQLSVINKQIATNAEEQIEIESQKADVIKRINASWLDEGINASKQLYEDWKKLRAENPIAQINDTAFEAGKDALAEFFQTGIDGSKNLRDAFNDMANNVVQAIDKMVTQMIASRVMETVFSSVPGLQLPPLGKAGGGLVAGPGSGTSDSIPARLSNGEFVVRSAVVRQPGALQHLREFNARGMPSPVGFAGGGLAVNSASSGGMVFNQHVHGVSDVSGFRKSEAQIAAASIRMLSKGRRNT